MTSGSQAQEPQGLFLNSRSEYRGLQRKIETYLPPVTAVELLDEWVPTQVNHSLGPLYQLMRTRESELGSLKAAEGNRKTAQEAQWHVKRFFELTDPKRLAIDVQAALDFSSIWRCYSAFFELLENRFHAPELLRRYRLPEEHVLGLATATSVAPIQVVFSELQVFAQNLRAHFDQLRELSDGAFLRKAAAVGAGVVGYMVGGRLGAKAAAAATGAVLSPADKIRQSTAQAHGAFTCFAHSYYGCLETLRSNLALVLTTLYGGLALRLQQDFNHLGYALGHMDWQNGTIYLLLSKEKSKEFQDWASQIRAEIDQAAAQSNWQRAADLADAALQVTMFDSARWREGVRDEEISWAVSFARSRAMAFGQVADEAWKRGRALEAAIIYRQTLVGTPVCWDDEDDPSFDMDVAGFRLALVATSSVGLVGGAERVAAATLPVHIYQSLIRIDYLGGWFAVPGEAASGISMVIAGALARYFKATGDTVNLQERLPEELKGCRAPTSWFETRNMPSLEPGMLRYLRELSDCPTVLDSPILGWLESERVGHETALARQKKRRLFGGLAIAATIVAAFLGIYFVAVWLGTSMRTTVDKDHVRGWVITSPAGAAVNLGRSSFGNAPCPIRGNLMSSNAKISAYLPGYGRATKSFPLGDRKEIVVIELSPLPRRVEISSSHAAYLYVNDERQERSERHVLSKVTLPLHLKLEARSREPWEVTIGKETRGWQETEDAMVIRYSDINLRRTRRRERRRSRSPSQDNSGAAEPLSSSPVGGSSAAEPIPANSRDAANGFRANPFD